MGNRRFRFAALAAVFLVFGVPALLWNAAGPGAPEADGTPGGECSDGVRTITGVVKAGETMAAIFDRYGLDPRDLFEMRQASASVHRFRSISAGRPYRIETDAANGVLSLTYQIDDAMYLRVSRTGSAFEAVKVDIEYETRSGLLEGAIETNLVSSLGGDPGGILLALELSDIFSWDIDFTTDLRKGDSFRLVVEERWLDGEFRGYGNILAAEFVNGGEVYKAYRYEAGGEAGYFDEEGKSLRKAFLKAPLSYRRISSGYTGSRMHPILKIRRPHFGVDYAASAGTPVQALGDGRVRFAGYKGANGNLIVLEHRGGYSTYYGHLSRFGKGIRRGSRVGQGDVIGYVGSTGRSTGPHLDFRIRKDGKYVNPLTVRLPRGRSVPESSMAAYELFRRGMDERLAATPGSAPPGLAATGASFLR
ncbi:MAG: peptidoglycan DD-metalloendopeptidase family protein [Thermodesulfobacteriota bacterium]